MCNCKSYNGYTGNDENVILELLDNVDTARQNRRVSIDYCISNVIQHLWDRGINTLGCCCGHNKDQPSVIVETSVNIDKAFGIIKEVDNRKWIVSRWERVEYER